MKPVMLETNLPLGPVDLNGPMATTGLSNGPTATAAGVYKVPRGGGGKFYQV